MSAPVVLVKLNLSCPICNTRFLAIAPEGTETVECPECKYDVGTIYKK